MNITNFAQKNYSIHKIANNDFVLKNITTNTRIHTKISVNIVTSVSKLPVHFERNIFSTRFSPKKIRFFSFICSENSIICWENVCLVTFSGSHVFYSQLDDGIILNKKVVKCAMNKLKIERKRKLKEKQIFDLTLIYFVNYATMHKNRRFFSHINITTIQ